MLKPQKRTLELKLPMERTGAVHSADDVLEAARDTANPFGQCSQAVLHSAAGRRPRPPPLWFPPAAPAQQEHPRLCFQHMFSQAPTWWRFNPQDRTLCRICALSMPDFFSPGRHSETQSGQQRPILAPKSV